MLISQSVFATIEFNSTDWAELNRVRCERLFELFSLFEVIRMVLLVHDSHYDNLIRHSAKRKRPSDHHERLARYLLNVD